MSLLAILSAAGAYIAVAIACTPSLARWAWGGEWTPAISHLEAILIGVILALVWPITYLVFGLSKGLQWAERRIFGDEGQRL